MHKSPLGGIYLNRDIILFFYLTLFSWHDFMLPYRPEEVSYSASHLLTNLLAKL